MLLDTPGSGELRISRRPIEWLLTEVGKCSRDWGLNHVSDFVVHGGNGGLTRKWPHHEVVISGTHLLRTSGLQSHHTNSGCSNREMQLQM